MKKYCSVVLLFTLAFLAANQVVAQDASHAGFEKIKSLAGEWNGVKSDGEKVRLTYEVMSNGSAVVETLKPVNEPNMVTIYHLDGDRLMMTHYCSAGNQPRMVAEISGSEVSQIDFNLQDITNLESSSAGHMKNLALKFEDSGKLTQVWTFSMEGEARPATFNFERKK